MVGNVRVPLEPATDPIMTMKTPNLFSRPVSRRAVCLGLGATTLSAAAGPAHAAAEWPIRPVTVVVPYAPGGNTDMMARLSSQYLANKLGQPFVIENRAGGGGAVGAIGVARARPDGYTLLFGASTQLVNIPMLQKVVYSHRDFTPISIFRRRPLSARHQVDASGQNASGVHRLREGPARRPQLWNRRRRRQRASQHRAVPLACRARHDGDPVQERRTGHGRPGGRRSRNVFRQRF